uniref:Putative methyltransferase n=1 Tax=viral metagenome TaxID=1070528 RepID=A0A6M3L8X1_9ZZZZ
MKLNLGCGTDIREKYFNVDRFKLPGVNFIHDLSIAPWPFGNDSVDEILMYHVLEHLPDTVEAMEELWRILKPGGRAYIRVPFWNSAGAFGDPTHKRYFRRETFDFFDPDKAHRRDYYSVAKFKVRCLSYRIWFLKGFRTKNKILIRLYNLISLFLCHMILEVELKLTAIKE